MELMTWRKLRKQATPAMLKMMEDGTASKISVSYALRRLPDSKRRASVLLRALAGLVAKGHITKGSRKSPTVWMAVRAIDGAADHPGRTIPEVLEDAWRPRMIRNTIIELSKETCKLLEKASKRYMMTETEIIDVLMRRSLEKLGL